MKESTITKPEVKTKIEENKTDDLLEEFKNEVFSRTKTNKLKVTAYAFLIVIIFALLGVATYQIFFKPEQIQDAKTASEKIEGRPQPTESDKEPENTTEEPKQVTPTPTPQPTEVSYTVQAGDTWSSIANSNDMTSAELMQYNGTSDLNLQIGQIVKVPKK